MQQSYFTSDWHLYGTNFLKNEKRSHFANVEEMNETIINNILTTLKPGDNLYFLGDIGWKFPEGYVDSIFRKFKSHRINFFWIEGNHDAIHPESSSIKWRGQIKDIVIKKQPITLCHYPMLVWNRSHYDSLSFHGHVHYKDSTFNRISKFLPTTVDDISSLRFNVNTELSLFKPLAFDEIMEIVKPFGLHNFDYIERSKEGNQWVST